MFSKNRIVTPTIIQPASFGSWVSEAFDLWRAWQRIYRPDSASAKLIDQVRRRRWLVCIIHHEYAEPDGLWDLLVQWAGEKGSKKEADSQGQ